MRSRGDTCFAITLVAGEFVASGIGINVARYLRTQPPGVSTEKKPATPDRMRKFTLSEAPW